MLKHSAVHALAAAQVCCTHFLKYFLEGRRIVFDGVEHLAVNRHDHHFQIMDLAGYIRQDVDDLALEPFQITLDRPHGVPLHQLSGRYFYQLRSLGALVLRFATTLTHGALGAEGC